MPFQKRTLGYSHHIDLGGMAVAAMFSAFANFIVYNAPDDTKIRETSFWLLGGIAGGSGQS